MVLAYYQALWEAGVDVDVVPVTADLSRYDVVVAPALHMIKDDLPERLEAVAARGGSVVATFLSGRVDRDDNAFLMDVPGPLGRLMGVRVDEWDARPAGVVNPVALQDGAGRVDVPARLLFELLIPQGAEVLGTYQADFFAGAAAVTRNAFGAGYGWYVGTCLDQAGVSWVIRQVLDHHDMSGRHPGLESAVRVAPDGTRMMFLLNHGPEPVATTAGAGGVDLVTGAQIDRGERISVEPRGVLVLRDGGPGSCRRSR
jgi:beta-galactosidase